MTFKLWMLNFTKVFVGCCKCIKSNRPIRKLTLFILFRENDINGVIDTTFSVEYDRFGHLEVQELMPGGKDIPVTEQNKQEYVKLYVKYRFRRGIEQQFHALKKGFNELVPASLLEPFDEKELEVSLLLSLSFAFSLTFCITFSLSVSLSLDECSYWYLFAVGDWWFRNN